MLYLMRQCIHGLKKSNPKLSACFHPVSCNFPKANNQPSKWRQNKLFTFRSPPTPGTPGDTTRMLLFSSLEPFKVWCWQRGFTSRQKEAEPWLTASAWRDQWAAGAAHIKKNNTLQVTCAPLDGFDSVGVQLHRRQWTGFFLCLLLPLIAIKEY